MVGLNPETMRKIREFGLRKVEKNDKMHGKHHIFSVVRNARHLAEKENADIKICEAAAWLHDIAKKTHGKKHAEYGAKISEEFLNKIGLDEDLVKRIARVIRLHNTQKCEKIEEKVLWDADKLHCISCYGFLRQFLYWKEIKGDLDEALEVCKEEWDFFVPKFYTKSAKEFIKKQVKLMNKFFEFCENYKNYHW